MTQRVRSIDWLRGLSVVVMVQCHALCLLDLEKCSGWLYMALTWLDGLVAPAFFFAAGASLALVFCQAAARGQRRQRIRKSARRIGEVLLVSSLMTWMWFPIFREPHWLLRIDVLSSLGLSLALLLLPVALLAAQPRWLSALAFVAAVELAFASPWLGQRSGALAPFLGISTGSVFPLAPWMSHSLLGVAVGARLGNSSDESARAKSSLRELLVWSLVLWGIAWVLAPISPPADPWSEPKGHIERWCEVLALLWALSALERRVLAREGASSSISTRPGWLRRWIERFGEHSLTAYAVHEVLLYVPIAGFCFFDAFGARANWFSYALDVIVLLWLTGVAVLGVATVSTVGGRKVPSAATSSTPYSPAPRG
jgi:uncharacterized membrane protein